MEGSVNIRERIEGTLGVLRPSERRVASHVLAHFDDVSAMTIADLADAAGVSQPTVIRFSRALGFSGYREFRYALGHADDGIGFVPLIGVDVLPWDHVAAVPGKVIGGIKSMLDDLNHALDARAYTKAVRALSSARTIDVYGAADSAVPATDLFHKLTYLGLDCRMFSDAHLMRTAAAHLNSRDVAIAFSYSGASPETVHALETARRAGASTIAVTNVPGSPICDHADMPLLAGGSAALDGAAVEPVDAHAVVSRAAHAAVVDMLYLGLVAQDYDRAMTALEANAAAGGCAASESAVMVASDNHDM